MQRQTGCPGDMETPHVQNSVGTQTVEGFMPLWPVQLVWALVPVATLAVSTHPPPPPPHYWQYQYEGAYQSWVPAAAERLKPTRKPSRWPSSRRQSEEPRSEERAVTNEPPAGQAIPSRPRRAPPVPPEEHDIPPRPRQVPPAPSAELEAACCSHGHPLQWLAVPYEAVCDRCASLLKQGASAWRCPQCQFEVCSPCRADSQPPQAQQQAQQPTQPQQPLLQHRDSSVRDSSQHSHSSHFCRCVLVEVIQAAKREGKYEELVQHLLMARTKAKGTARLPDNARGPTQTEEAEDEIASQMSTEEAVDEVASQSLDMNATHVERLVLAGAGWCRREPSQSHIGTAGPE